MADKKLSPTEFALNEALHDLKKAREELAFEKEWSASLQHIRENLNDCITKKEKELASAKADARSCAECSHLTNDEIEKARLKAKREVITAIETEPMGNLARLLAYCGDGAGCVHGRCVAWRAFKEKHLDKTKGVVLETVKPELKAEEVSPSGRAMKMGTPVKCREARTSKPAPSAMARHIVELGKRKQISKKELAELEALQQKMEKLAPTAAKDLPLRAAVAEAYAKQPPLPKATKEQDKEMARRMLAAKKVRK